jgi:hypothetical protein
LDVELVAGVDQVRAMGVPMMPRPMNPIFMMFYPFVVKY